MLPKTKSSYSTDEYSRYRNTLYFVALRRYIAYPLPSRTQNIPKPIYRMACTLIIEYNSGVPVVPVLGLAKVTWPPVRKVSPASSVSARGVIHSPEVSRGKYSHIQVCIGVHAAPHSTGPHRPQNAQPSLRPARPDKDSAAAATGGKQGSRHR